MSSPLPCANAIHTTPGPRAAHQAGKAAAVGVQTRLGCSSLPLSRKCTGALKSTVDYRPFAYSWFAGLWNGMLLTMKTTIDAAGRLVIPKARRPWLVWFRN